MFASITSVGPMIGQIQLDIGGFLLGPEFAAVLANLFATLFSTFTNAFFAGAFA